MFFILNQLINLVVIGLLFAVLAKIEQLSRKMDRALNKPEFYTKSQYLKK